MNSLIVLAMRGMYGLKPALQQHLRPLARQLALVGIRANHVTIFACALSAIFCVLLMSYADPRLFVLLPAIFLVRMVLNALDGMLAREWRQASRLGIYLNELSDVVSDTFLYLPFTQLPDFRPQWIWTVIVLSVITEMSGVIGVMAGAERRYDGPMGKSDRAFVFSIAGLLIGFGRLAPVVAVLLPIIISALLALTLFNRVRHGLLEAATIPSGGNKHASM